VTYEYGTNGQLSCFLGAFYLHHVYLSVSARVPPTQRTYIKFDTGDFYENLSRKSKFG